MKRLTMKQIKVHRVPRKSATIWWLGQAGFIVKTPGGKIAVLDPFLSNSCQAIGKQHGFRLDRQVPPPLPASDLVGVDLYLITHSHQDRLDPEPRRAVSQVRRTRQIRCARRSLGASFFQSEFRKGKRRWCGRTRVSRLATSPCAQLLPSLLAAMPFTHVGYLVFIKGGPTIYFTGDTAYEEILGEAVAPHKPDVLVTVINGAFRNLGPAEAALLAKRLKVKIVIPCHHDLFLDNCQPPQMLHTNLKLQGMGNSYRLLEQGVPFRFARP